MVTVPTAPIAATAPKAMNVITAVPMHFMNRYSSSNIIALAVVVSFLFEKDSNYDD